MAWVLGNRPEFFRALFLILCFHYLASSPTVPPHLIGSLIVKYPVFFYKKPFYWRTCRNHCSGRRAAQKGKPPQFTGFLRLPLSLLLLPQAVQDKREFPQLYGLSVKVSGICCGQLQKLRIFIHWISLFPLWVFDMWTARLFFPLNSFPHSWQVYTNWPGKYWLHVFPQVVLVLVLLSADATFHQRWVWIPLNVAFKDSRVGCWNKGAFINYAITFGGPERPPYVIL